MCLQGIASAALFLAACAAPEALAGDEPAEIVHVDEHGSPAQRKKLIKFGWDRPNAAYVRENIRRMEERPFDGVVIQVTRSREPIAEPRDGGTQDSLAWLTFSASRFQPRDYEHAIEDLRATKFERFRDNFILLNSMPGLDWFDLEWDSVAHNAKVLARVANEGGCVGLVFDAEEYGAQKIWTYSSLPAARQQEVPREHYVRKVRERGAEFMRAINSEFADAKVMFCWGPATSLRTAGRYDLLAPFAEGMCRAASPATEIIDGYEQSYAYKDRINFERGREEMKLKSRELFQDKAAFDRVMRVGFGLWMDYNSGRLGWHTEDFSRNHFTPEEFGRAVRAALDVSDGYVWIYTERLNWWKDENVPDAYLQALERARAHGNE